MTRQPIPAGTPASQDRQASSFGAAAASYARARPGYPRAAVDWLVPPAARKVVDLGAGTGQLTRQLVSRGLDVTAVEPSPQMRDELLRSTPGARVMPGAAEAIPLPDASADAVLVAQAWHWADHSRAVPEVARVLVAGGRIGLMWNVRDVRNPWVAELESIMHRYTKQEGDTTPVLFAPFEHVEHRTISWTRQLTPSDLLELVASRSFVITLEADEREALMADIARFVATAPAVAGKRYLDLPYLTRCTRAALPGMRDRVA